MKYCVCLIIAVLGVHPAAVAHDDAHKTQGAAGAAATVTVAAANGPRLRVELAAAGPSRHELRLLTENFRFVPAQDAAPRVIGEGHAHLYVDGNKIGRVYAATHPLPALAPGVHHIAVELATSDHAIYHVDGHPVVAHIALRVGKPAKDRNLRPVKDFTAIIAGGAVVRDTLRATRGDTVRIHWQSDAATTLHLHGYDIEAEVAPGAPLTMQFDADIAGRFPVASHEQAKSGGHGHRALLYVEVYPE